MQCKITILTENSVGVSKGLIAEHGFSCILNDGEKTILFDTGQGIGLLKNAPSMSIDLSKIDFIVLSHCHYDHTGGLYELLNSIGERPIICHPEIFKKRYFKGEMDGKNIQKEIGLLTTKEKLESVGAQLRFSTTPMQITSSVIVTGEIPREEKIEKPQQGFFIKEKGSLKPDTIPDDQALIIKSQNGVSVITGCAHSGIINTILYALRLTGASKIYALIGGFHLMGASEDYLKAIIKKLKDIDVQMVATCHCTGPASTAKLYKALGDRVRFITTGAKILV